MTDAELQAKLDKWFNRYNRYLDDEINNKLYNQSRFFNQVGNTKQSMTAEMFKQKFNGDHFDEIVNTLNSQLKQGYFWKIDKDRKESIVKMLYAMGLDEDAKYLQKLGIRKFKQLDKENMWDFVKDIYGQQREDIVAEYVAGKANNLLEDDIIDIIKEKGYGNLAKEQLEEMYERLGWK